MKILIFILAITLLMDNLLPLVLAHFYPNYIHKETALSVLGSRQSPVKWIYNIWCIVSGIVFCIGTTIRRFFPICANFQQKKRSSACSEEHTLSLEYVNAQKSRTFVKCSGLLLPFRTLTSLARNSIMKE